MVLVQNVSKRYRLYPRPMDRLRELVPGSRCRDTDFWALRDIDFLTRPQIRDPGRRPSVHRFEGDGIMEWHVSR